MSQYETLKTFKNGKVALIDTKDENRRYVVAKYYNEQYQVWDSYRRYDNIEEAEKQFKLEGPTKEAILNYVYLSRDIDPEKDSGLCKTLEEKVLYAGIEELFNTDFLRECDKEKQLESIREKEFPIICNMNDLIDVIEEMGWNVRVYEEDLEIAQESNAGEDFFFSVCKEEGLQETIEKICECCDYFDYEEHAKMWAECSGKRGVPDMDALIEDAKDIELSLEELKVALERCEVNEKEMEEEREK